jgi:hypothetical protein
MSTSYYADRINLYFLQQQHPDWSQQEYADAGIVNLTLFQFCRVSQSGATRLFQAKYTPSRKWLSQADSSDSLTKLESARSSLLQPLFSGGTANAAVMKALTYILPGIIE